METETCIATFFTTHAALRAEALVKEGGIPGRLIPAPRHLSADCTLAMSFPSARRDEVERILGAGGIETSGFHLIDLEA